jgi:hypothetical protein
MRRRRRWGRRRTLPLEMTKRTNSVGLLENWWNSITNSLQLFSFSVFGFQQEINRLILQNLPSNERVWLSILWTLLYVLNFTI